MGKRDNKAEQEEQHEAKFPKAKGKQRSGQKQQKTAPNGNCCHEKTCNKQKGKIGMN